MRKKQWPTWDLRRKSPNFFIFWLNILIVRLKFEIFYAFQLQTDSYFDGKSNDNHFDGKTDGEFLVKWPIFKKKNTNFLCDFMKLQQFFSTLKLGYFSSPKSQFSQKPSFSEKITAIFNIILTIFDKTALFRSSWNQRFSRNNVFTGSFTWNFWRVFIRISDKKGFLYENHHFFENNTCLTYCSLNNLKMNLQQNLSFCKIRFDWFRVSIENRVWVDIRQFQKQLWVCNFCCWSENAQESISAKLRNFCNP